MIGVKSFSGPQAAKRDTEKAGGVRTVAVAANESSGNVLPLDLGNRESASIWVHWQRFVFDLKTITTRLNG